MNHGSLFSGIGGFDLAAQWMGWDNVFHCELNPFGRRVLSHYWPKAISYEDITKTDFSIYAGAIDILTGGFPCQPYSTAGKRLGKEDDRHLWPEMLRAIREIKPSYVVGENVRGLLSWNGGLVFDEVQADLESEGYEVIPFLLPACAVNAPHRRDRIWFIAHSNNLRSHQQEKPQEQPGGTQVGSTGQKYGIKSSTNASSDGHERRMLRKDRRTKAESEGVGEQRKRIRLYAGGVGKQETFTNSNGSGLQVITSGEQHSFSKEEGASTRGKLVRGNTKTERWESFPTQSPVCGGNDGLPTELDGIAFSKWRNESIKAYGNAIVPQVAYQILKAIEETQLSITK